MKAIFNQRRNEFEAKYKELKFNEWKDSLKNRK
jgi:hypothetical protein